MIKADSEKKELEISGTPVRIGSDITAIMVGAYETISGKSDNVMSAGIITSAFAAWLKYVKESDNEIADMSMSFLNDFFSGMTKDEPDPKPAGSGWRRLS